MRFSGLQCAFRIALHDDAEPFFQTDHFPEIFAGLGRIDIDGADDLDAVVLGELFDDGAADGTETKMQNTNNRHPLEIINDDETPRAEALEYRGRAVSGRL